MSPRIPLIALAYLAATTPLAAQQKSLPEQIADVMVQLNSGIHTGFRFAHAKGMVATGTFTATPGAASISKAAHFKPGSVPVTVRFSDGTGVPEINDDNANASPRGMAIRFMIGKSYTDIVSNSHNGFFVGNGDDFLAFIKAIAASAQSTTHPSPIDAFLGAHPRALKVIVDSKPKPASFGTLAYFGNNAFIFVDSTGTKRAGRYQIIPEAGIHSIDSAAAAKAGPNYMFDELTRRIAKGPIKFKLYVQLANAGDPTNDGSMVWPDDRKKVEMGELSITALVPDNQTAQRDLRFNPILVTSGIELSDDPLVPLRSAVYAISVSHRH